MIVSPGDAIFVVFAGPRSFILELILKTLRGVPGAILASKSLEENSLLAII